MDNTFNPDELEQKLALKLTMSALQGEGSVPAARQVLEVIDRIRSRQAEEEHRRKMTDLATQPVELVRYLGYLGEARKDVERQLERGLKARRGRGSCRGAASAPARASRR